MSARILYPAAATLLVLAAALAALAQHNAGPAQALAPISLSPGACQIRTLAAGDTSGFGWSQPGFTGAELIIRSQDEFWRFWEQHTSLQSPPPEQPYVDFATHVVVAVVQGIQTTGGGPSITITDIQLDAANHPANVTIRIVDDERPGPLDALTNPYHIVVVRKACLPPGSSVTFLHVAPVPGTGVIRGTVWVPADATDWRGLPEATVRLWDSNGDLRTTLTGYDGSYRFLSLTPGTYVLDASNPPYYGDPATAGVMPDAAVLLDFYLSVGR